MNGNRAVLSKFEASFWALLSSIILFDSFLALFYINKGSWENALITVFLGWLYWPISIPTCLIMAPVVFFALCLYKISNFKTRFSVFCFAVVGSLAALMLQALFFGITFKAPLVPLLLPPVALLDGLLIYCLGAPLGLFKKESSESTGNSE